MASIKELKEICQKKRDVSWLSRHFYRPVSIFITSLVVRTSVSANSISVAGILVWLAGALLLISQKTLSQIGCVICLQLGSLFDHVDGEVARYRKRGGYGGRYLDYVGHLLLEPTVFVCLGISVFYSLHYALALYLGVLVAMSKISLLSGKQHVLVDLIRNDLVDPNDKQIRAVMADKPQLSSTGGKVSSVERLARNTIAVTGQILGFPGYIVAISLAVVLDLVFPPFRVSGFPVNFRFLVLLANVLFVLNLPRTLHIYFAVLERIKGHASQGDESSAKELLCMGSAGMICKDG